MSLRMKFVLPINVVLVLALVGSLAWQWLRLEESGLAVLRARLGEEARFVRAAYRQFGPSPRFDGFLAEFCHATDALASPEHQVAVVGRSGEVIASAAEHARRPMDPVRLAGLGEGFQLRSDGGETFLIRVVEDGTVSVVVAESLRAVRARVRETLRDQAAWFLGSGVLLIGVVNLIMSRAVLRPIRHLYRAASRMGQGQLGVQVEAPGRDELSALGRQFNAMSRSIALQVEAERRELETASRVQAHLLPSPHLHYDGLEFVGRCLQAGPVGGDLYDVQPLTGDRVGLLVADLSGHNVAAALHTAMVRAILWREAEGAATPGEALARLNGLLCRNLPEEHFATAFFAWFDPRHGRLRYANAGHPPAFLRTPGGSIRELEATGPLLGIIDGAAYGDGDIEFEPGTLLLAYTDGVIEAQGEDGVLFGEGRVRSHFAACRSPDLSWTADDLLSRVSGHRGHQAQQDDLTILLAKICNGSTSS